MCFITWHFMCDLVNKHRSVIALELLRHKQFLRFHHQTFNTLNRQLSIRHLCCCSSLYFVTCTIKLQSNTSYIIGSYVYRYTYTRHTADSKQCILWFGMVAIRQCDIYTGCNRRKGPDFGRVFLMLNYTDIT